MTTYAPPPHPGWHIPRPEPVQVRPEADAFAAVLTRIRTSRPSINTHPRAAPWLSQPDLAGLAGIHRVALMRLERGERTPKAATVRALVEALSTTPEERAELFLAAGFVDTGSPA